MARAEQLATSIITENSGVHVLLWRDQDDLVFTLIPLLAAMPGYAFSPLLLSSDDESQNTLRELMDLRLEQSLVDSTNNTRRDSDKKAYWLFFIQRAVSKTVGPWLNGWRRFIAQDPGALLVIRQADFDAFQRHAPDLASFIGPRIFDSSTMLYIWNNETNERIKNKLPNDLSAILDDLPGEPVSQKIIEAWIARNSPEAGLG